MSITPVYWIIFILSHFVTCNIGIYICIYIFIKLVIFILFLLSSIVMFFLHCMLNILRYQKHFWNWWVDCFIAQSIKSCDILGAHSEPIFPFMQCFFSFQCFLWSSCLLLIAESISLDTSGKLTVGFFLKISSSSCVILSISLNELNSSEWLLRRWWWIFLK